jgi:hypothetical protein
LISNIFDILLTCKVDSILTSKIWHQIKFTYTFVSDEKQHDAKCVNKEIPNNIHDINSCVEKNLNLTFDKFFIHASSFYFLLALWGETFRYMQSKSITYDINKSFVVATHQLKTESNLKF